MENQIESQKIISMPFTIISLIFCMCFVIDTFLELKVVSLFGISFTTGVLLIVVNYIISDCLVEVYGFKRAKQVIWLTFAVEVFVIMILQISCWLPVADYWEGEEHFQYIFGATPRIAIASIAAFICGSTTNAWIMSKMKVRQKGKHFKVRAFVSTIFGEYVDVITFYLLAFAGVIPMIEVIGIMFGQGTAKIAIEGLVLPITHRVVDFLKVYDGIDVYDG